MEEAYFILALDLGSGLVRDGIISLSRHFPTETEAWAYLKDNHPYSEHGSALGFVVVKGKIFAIAADLRVATPGPPGQQREKPIAYRLPANPEPVT